MVAEHWSTGTTLNTRFTTERTVRRLDPEQRGLPTDRNMSSPAAAATTATDPGEGLASQHKLKLKPPSYDGGYSTFEDWHYKFKACMGVQHNFYTLFLPRAAQSTTRLTEAELRGQPLQHRNKRNGSNWTTT